VLGLTATFTASSLTGCTPMITNFNDISSPSSSSSPINSWAWDFGDGGTSTVQHPKYTFTKAGSYKVELTVSDGSAFSSYSLIIKVLKNPVADFSIAKPEYCPGDAILFSNKTTLGDTTIRSSTWDFGDGNIVSSKTDVTKTYNLAGFYTVKLTIRDFFGCQNVVAKSGFVTINASPKADFNIVYKYTCAPPLKVNFVNKSSTNSTTYQWDMGNGNTFTDQNPVDFYNLANNYTVTMVASTAKGCSNKKTLPLSVTFDPLKSDFTADKLAGCIPFDPKLKNNSTPAGANVDFLWDFGDGTKSILANPPKIYPKTGTYNVKLKISGMGCADSVTKKMLVSEKPKSVIWVKDTLSCIGFLNTTFKAPEKNIVSWTWFIDGKNLITKVDSLAYYFEKPGIYDVFVLLQNDVGCEQYIQYPKIVVQNLLVGFRFVDDGGCKPYTPVIIDTSKVKIPTSLTYIWDDGLGSRSNLPIPKFTYVKEGQFDLTLTIMDTFGCIDSIPEVVYVGHKVPPSFRMSKTVLCNNEYITFYNTTPKNLRKEVDTWKWLFGTESGKIADSFQTRTRDFPKTLTPFLITENNHCRDTMAKMDSVKLNGPAADFIYTFDTCNMPTAKLKHNSVLATSFKWILPDGKTTSQDTFIRQRITPFKKVYYTVIAYNNVSKCSDTVEQLISLPRSVSTMKIVKVSGTCTPVTYTVFNYQTKANRSHWDFGNSDTSNLNPGGTDSFLYTFTQPGKFVIKHTGWDVRSCIFESSATVAIAGPAVSGKVWPLKGCLPLKINLQDSFSPNTPYKIKRKYWKIQDEDSIIPASNTDSVIEFTIKNMPKNGDTIVHVELFVEDINGCLSSKVFKIRPSGPKAYIFASKDIKCDVMTVKLEMVIDSLSTYLPASLVWNMGDGNTITENKFSYVYETGGFFFVKVKLTDALGCTFNDQVDVAVSQPELLAKFTIDNRSAVCPPLISQFTQKCIVDKNNAITDYSWDFGDGTTANIPNPGKIYTTPGTYDVSLTIRNRFGCTNTTVVKKAIQVGGPNGSYKLGSTQGCEPFAAHFEIKSNLQTTAEWDFGNGKTIVAENVDYTFTKAGIYFPKIILKDSGGCTVVIIPKDSVLVLRKPKAEYQFNSHCLDDSVIFTQQSVSNIASATLIPRWIIRSDTFKSTQLTHKFKNRGQYQVFLMVKNNNNCYDTMKQLITISKPTAEFVSFKDKLCLGDSLYILNKSSSELGQHKNIWKVNQAETDISTYRPAKGDLNIELVVTDSLDCTDTFRLQSKIHVADTLAASVITLDNVSAINDHEFDIRYQISNDADFDHYTLYHFENGSWTPIQQIFKKDSLQTQDQDYGIKKSQCYKVTQSNYCQAESDLSSSSEHCSIHTSALGAINHNVLTWTPYVGWPVMSYKIWRQNINSPAVFDSIAIVNGQTALYLDSGINCKTLHAYRVTAYGSSAEKISVSDSAKAKAVWTNTLPSPQIVFVTVDDDTSIHVKWQLNDKYRRSNYQDVLLYKNYTLGTQIKTFGILTTDFYDKKVSVDRFQYQYFTRVTDDCGDTSSASIISSNILLQSMSDGSFNAPELKWNAYVKWAGGVKQYEVQRLNELNVFETVQITNDTFFMDISATDLCMKQYRYRVIGTEQTLSGAGAPSISISNEIRVKPKSSLFVPNAFSPNSNGFNEIFAPKGQYIFNYQLEIYNRWGERIFISNECLGGWDGTYKNEPVEEGLYYYKLNASGNDGASYVYKGTLTLLR